MPIKPTPETADCPEQPPVSGKLASVRRTTLHLLTNDGILCKPDAKRSAVLANGENFVRLSLAHLVNCKDCKAKMQEQAASAGVKSA
jgi:hypothetical protein